MLCDDCQKSYNKWLSYEPWPWREQCYKCLAKGGPHYTGCTACTASLTKHREETWDLIRRQVELIERICERHHG